MAWIGVQLEGTILNEDPIEEAVLPVENAVEAINSLVAEGHRITVLTDKFAPMPEERRMELKKEIESQLGSLGMDPSVEVWAGTTAPKTDLNIGSKNVTFDNDWGLALAQLQVMLEDKGLVEIPPDDGMIDSHPVGTQEGEVDELH